MTPLEKGALLLSVVKMLVVFTAVMVIVALMTLAERKISAWFQNRIGPNRTGPGGLLQPAADGLKNFIKEETLPALANRGLFLLAPALAFMPALMLSSVIPFAAPLQVDFDRTLPLIGDVSYHGLMPMAVTDLPIGFLFVLAISSMGVYGIALAGWSSNSKYALLGGLRASAQMISYEVAMGLSLIPVLLMAGTARLGDIVTAQQDGLWYVGPLFLAFFVYLISGFAETNRLPFDMPEAESELVAGYHAEYSSMKFSMFFIAEYANVLTICMMVTTLFFGGWDIPLTTWDEQPGVLQTLATLLVFAAKTFFWVFFVMWIRWTLPRFRYDQLMALGWKFLMPLALAYIVITATGLWTLDRLLPDGSAALKAAVLTGLNVGLGAVVFLGLDRGTTVSGPPRAAALAEARPDLAPQAREPLPVES
jgi:NADH-quinone oxidoreductase subunit H